MGRKETLNPEHGKVLVAAGPEPAFLLGRATLLEERRPDRRIADGEADFSLKQGERGWTYEARIGATANGTRHVKLSPRSDTWGTFWALDRDAFLAIGAANMHPSANGDAPVAAVRTWTSSDAGDVMVLGQVDRTSDKGDGSGFRLTVDGRVLVNQILGTGRGPRSLTIFERLTLKRGSKVEVEVTPGPKADVSFDAVTVQLSIVGKKS
jgi:hypothetical protein